MQEKTWYYEKWVGCHATPLFLQDDMLNIKVHKKTLETFLEEIVYRIFQLP